MKRRIVGAGGVVLVIALLAIVAWYLVHTAATSAELNQAVAQYQSHTPVSVTFAIAVPDDTPKDQTLYLSGSVPALGNWDAAGIPLSRSDDGKYHATIPELLNGMEYAFKVTRGTWGSVETDKDNKDIANHTFTAAKDTAVAMQVAAWRDNGKAVPGKVTMTGDIRLLKKFHSDALNNERTLIVYLPPDYDRDPTVHYPVIYLQDGQNLMDQSTSYQGIEWGIDEAAQTLIAAGKIDPAIIVGVYNTETRNAEFTPPFAAVTKAPGQGDLYAKMLAQEIKPAIDARFRTKPDRASTYIGGGSMGAMISLYTAQTYPDTFGYVIALSPWLRMNDHSITSQFIGDGAWAKRTRFFIDMGTDPGHNYPADSATALADAQQLADKLQQLGLKRSVDFEYREIEGGRHNELSWSQTIDQVLITVLGKKPAAAAATAPSHPQ